MVTKNSVSETTTMKLTVAILSLIVRTWAQTQVTTSGSECPTYPEQHEANEDKYSKDKQHEYDSFNLIPNQAYVSDYKFRYSSDGRFGYVTCNPSNTIIDSDDREAKKEYDEFIESRGYHLYHSSEFEHSRSKPLLTGIIKCVNGTWIGQKRRPIRPCAVRWSGGWTQQWKLEQNLYSLKLQNKNGWGQICQDSAYYFQKCLGYISEDTLGLTDDDRYGSN